MKALSVRQPWANMIASGEKTIETRKWETVYRGYLLICSSRKPALSPAGYGICIVRLDGCIPMLPEHEKRACCSWYPGAWAWIFDEVTRITPFRVKGQLGLFEVALPQIESVKRIARDFAGEYTNLPIAEVRCRRCGIEMNQDDLVVSFDIEYGHPLNEGKHMNSPDLHATRFEDCPFCGTSLYADGRRIGG